MQGHLFGNPKNLTAMGRKLGLEKIKLKSKDNRQTQKILEIINKCKKA